MSIKRNSRPYETDPGQFSNQQTTHLIYTTIHDLTLRTKMTRQASYCYLSYRPPVKHANEGKESYTERCNSAKEAQATHNAILFQAKFEQWKQERKISQLTTEDSEINWPEIAAYLINEYHYSGEYGDNAFWLCSTE